MLDGKQDSVRGSPKCSNGYMQLVQLNQPPHHREEARTGVAYSSTPQSKELLVDPSHWYLPLHNSLTHCERIVARLAGQNNARNLEGRTDDGIEDSYEEGFQDSYGIAPSSKVVLLVSQKEERKIRLFSGP